MPTLTTVYGYDLTGTFLIETTNPLGQKSHISYDHKWGLPLAETGVDGLVIRYSYDGFGRLLSTTNPLQITTNIERDWDIGSGGLGLATEVKNSIYYIKKVTPGIPAKKTWYDSFGRKRKDEVDGFDQKIYAVTGYDSRGNIYSKTQPFFSVNNSPVITIYSYNDKNQLITAQNSAGTVSYAYSFPSNNLKTFTTQPNQQTTSKIVDGAGKLVEATDNGGTLSYTYYASGKQKEIKMAGTTIASMQYDLQGNQTSLFDANAGTIYYTYNAYGNLHTQIDDAGTTTLLYDNYNRIQSKSNSEGTVTYNYVQSGSGINQIRSIIHSNGSEENFFYDKYGRKREFSSTIENEEYKYKYTYDSYGRLMQEEFPSGFTTSRDYSATGYLKKIINAANNSLIWEGKKMNDLGRYTEVFKGDGLTTNYYYDNLGMLDYTTGAVNWDYTFEQTTGNLKDRRDNDHFNEESFEYDNLDRLKKITLDESSGTTVSHLQNIGYNANGNISHKGQITSYSYSNTRPNAVVGVNDLDNIINNDIQDISYNSLHQPELIVEGDYELELIYGSGGNRIVSELKQNGVLKRTRTYLPNYEKQVFSASNKEQLIHYIRGGNGLAAMYVIENGIGTMYYTYTDYLGSILKLTNASGSTVAEQSFDAWGRRRGVSDWNYNSAVSVPDWLYRGYTGHEHYDEFALVNMNGRMYDPLLGRMLSTDNYVADATGTQHYNRYAYALNNPLKFTDPNGELPFLVAIVIGAIVSVVTNGISNVSQGRNFFEGWARAAAIGAVSGAFAFGIGQAAAQLAGIGKAVFQTLAHAHLGGMMSSASGSTYMQGFLSGAIGSLVAAGAAGLLQNASAGIKTIGIVGSGGISGGIGAEIAGGDFWDGFRNGAISSGLNHLAHSLSDVNPTRLKERILKDGRLTLKEANQWYRHGGGKPLTVDASKIDLDWVVDPKLLIEGQQTTAHTFPLSKDGAVYGKLDIISLGGNDVSILPNEYDFRLDGSWFRNQYTKIGAYVAGKGTSYWIYFEGVNTINPPQYINQYPRGNKW